MTPERRAELRASIAGHLTHWAGISKSTVIELLDALDARERERERYRQWWGTERARAEIAEKRVAELEAELARVAELEGDVETAAALNEDMKRAADKYKARVAELESNIALTLERWSEETGDGSMWGADAYVLAPIGEVSEPEQRSAGEYRDARKRVAELEEERAQHAKAIAERDEALARAEGRTAELESNIALTLQPWSDQRDAERVRAEKAEKRVAELEGLQDTVVMHLPHYEPEFAAGDYVGIVRVAGHELAVTWPQENDQLSARVAELEGAVLSLLEWRAGYDGPLLNAGLDAVCELQKNVIGMR